MGKKGSWFSALKRAFTSSSKDPEKKNTKGKGAWGLGKSKHGEVNSFVPLYRQPSSIEQILGDAEREQYQKIFRGETRDQHHMVLVDTDKEQHHKVSGVAERERQRRATRDTDRERQHRATGDTDREQQHRDTGDTNRELSNKLQQVSPKKVERSKRRASKPNLTSNHARVSAIKIQSAYRGYMARKSYRSLKALVRLQGAMKGQNVKRQTVNTMRCMQLLVRVQSQIRARRLQMTESRHIQQHKSDKEADSSKWSLTHQSEGEGNEDWEDSVLTKEEIDARMQRKVEAVIKRERALAYAYSHQLLKVTSKSAHAVLSDIRSGGYPWWWNWLERHLPTDPTPTTPKPAVAATFRPTSSRSTMTAQAIHEHLDAHTPRSVKPKQSRFAFSAGVRDDDSLTSCPDAPTPHSVKPKQSRFAFSAGLRDDDSLTSCPAYTAAPRYMATTASAKAKVRSNVDEFAREGKRRFSFGLGSSIGSLRWGKSGSLFAGPAPAPAPGRSPAVTARHRSSQSIGGLSVDSTVSLPVGVGRKPFR